MNPKTGDVKEFESTEAAVKAGYTAGLRCKPKPGCRECFGRGHVGRKGLEFVLYGCCAGVPLQ